MMAIWTEDEQQGVMAMEVSPDDAGCDGLGDSDRSKARADGHQARDEAAHESGGAGAGRVLRAGHGAETPDAPPKVRP